MSKGRNLRVGVGFWFQWVLINAAGLAIGMTVRQFLLGLGGVATSPVVVGVIVGTSVGLAQLFSLDRASRRPGWWVLASIIGWTIGWGLGWSTGWSIVGNLGFNAVFGLIGALAGAIAGTIQWIILRPQIHQAGWWVLANTVGWAIGLVVGISLGRNFGWVLAGAVSGAITGLALVWLLRQPSQRQ